ncbi:hypothetical protein [Pseudomonas sp. PGPR40]|uniref:hypothetical protein n=1 Tax=Pseudomonas sp. PGPR40 TaxID=2913476 RepID=UPI001EDBD9B9|nr:hypothetical protein [Pseudomonas sp. PGPR40]
MRAEQTTIYQGWSLGVPNPKARIAMKKGSPEITLDKNLDTIADFLALCAASKEARMSCAIA